MILKTTTLDGSTYTRRRYEGMLQVLRFNYPMFLTAATCVTAGVVALSLFDPPPIVRGCVGPLLALGTFWILATIAVSHLVYDTFSLFTFRWLQPHVPGDIRTWINIHAGFDSSTRALRHAFPLSQGSAIDLFDPTIMTEKSIHRARTSTPVVAGTLQGRFDALPFANASQDTVFMLFAAHELRTRSQRAALFRETARTLHPGGFVILVEHLRAPANALAFGPGVFHFHTHTEWQRAANATGLTPAAEFSLTPFATCLIWRKP